MHRRTIRRQCSSVITWFTLVVAVAFFTWPGLADGQKVVVGKSPLDLGGAGGTVMGPENPRGEPGGPGAREMERAITKGVDDAAPWSDRILRSPHGADRWFRGAGRIPSPKHPDRVLGTSTAFHE